MSREKPSIACNKLPLYIRYQQNSNCIKASVKTFIQPFSYVFWLPLILTFYSILLLFLVKGLLCFMQHSCSYCNGHYTNLFLDNDDNNNAVLAAHTLHYGMAFAGCCSLRFTMSTCSCPPPSSLSTDHSSSLTRPVSSSSACPVDCHKHNQSFNQKKFADIHPKQRLGRMFVHIRCHEMPNGSAL